MRRPEHDRFPVEAVTEDEMADETRALVDRLRRTVDERQHLYLSFLCGLLRFETVSGQEKSRPPRSEDPPFRDAWRYLQHETERLGLEFRTYDDEAGVIEWLGTDPDAPALGVAVHLDVVPTEEGWTLPPFAGAIHEGDVWGRGAQDDKGPLASVVSAIDALQTLGLRPRRTIRIFIGTFEETEDWPDIDRLLANEEPPSEVLVPDGGFPIGIGEKGIVTIEWAADWPRQSQGEGPLHFVSLFGGRRANVVPAGAELRFEARSTESAEAERFLESAAVRLAQILPHATLRLIEDTPASEGMTTYVVQFDGKAAHAAMPKEGHNAALDALAYLTLIRGLHPQVQAFSRLVYAATRPLDGSGLDLDRSHPSMGETTINLGRIEMDRAGAHAWTNVRFPMGTSPRDVEEAFRRQAEAVKDEHEDSTALRIHTEMIGRPQPPFLVDTTKHRAFIEKLETAYESVTGAKAEHLCIAGTTYAKLFPLAVGFGPVDLARGEPVRVHQRNERVAVERHLENVRIYATAFALLACDGDRPRDR